MKRHVFWVTLALFAAFAGASLVYGQAADRLVVNIPYTFAVDGRQLPAGEYTIERTNMENILMIRSADLKSAFQLRVLTRISADPAGDSRVVLDKYEGDRYTISEVFFPVEDGYLITGAKNIPHKHELIKAKTSR